LVEVYGVELMDAEKARNGILISENADEENFKLVTTVGQ
jgi:hypothetical protein